MNLKWKKGSAYYWDLCDEAGLSMGFTVCKVTVRGDTFFEAWKGSRMLGCHFPDFEGAAAVVKKKIRGL